MGEGLPASAVVLAGGRSSRFGGQKLAADLDGVPLVHRAIRAVAEVSEEVIVVGPPSGLDVGIPADLLRDVRLILDAEPFAGPLVALGDALPSVRHERIVLVGGDMPNLRPAILRRVLAWAPPREGACLVAEGVDQPFPMGLDRAVARTRARELVDQGKRSLRALIGSLDIERVSEAEWRKIDPGALSLSDIDRPGDIDDLAGSNDAEAADIDEVVHRK